jgi:hypothetical protein
VHLTVSHFEYLEKVWNFTENVTIINVTIIDSFWPTNDAAQQLQLVLVLTSSQGMNM